MTAGRAIRAYLDAHPGEVESKVLVYALGLEASTVSQACKREVARGGIRKVRHGVYASLAEPETASTGTIRSTAVIAIAILAVGRSDVA